MYNPFKWHIITYRNRFLVRKLTLLGFVYQDKTDEMRWYCLEKGIKYCSFATKTDAQMFLSTLKVERV
jgi:hypothetical protein